MKKLKTMFPIVLVLLFSILTASALAQKIPVTSSSEKAVELFYQSWTAFENAEIAKGNNLLNEALQKDPGFFMGHFTLAMNNLYSGNQAEFKSHAEKAVGSKAKLSRAEKLLKSAIEKLAENPKANVTDVGRKLIELHPNDKIAYYLQSQFQMIIKDLDACLKTFNQLLEITDSPGAVYNMIGYTQMNLENYEAAEKAFDRYIALVPNHPNPYDSKGDYFMQVKDYPNAFLSYMKANELDNNWSYGKALKANELLGSFGAGNPQAFKLYLEGLHLHQQAEVTQNRTLDNQAEVMFKKALAIESGHLPSLIQLGWIYSSKETKRFWEEGYLDSAFYWANRALKSNDYSSGVYNLLSKLYQQKGNYEKAFEMNDKAILHDQGQDMSYLNRGGLYFNTGNYLKAVEMTCNQIDLDIKTGDNYWSLFNMFNQLCRTGFIAESDKFNERILKMNKDSASYCDKIMFEHFLSGNFDQTIELAINRMKTNPNDINCKYYLGWSNLFLKNEDEAYKWFNEIVEASKTTGQQVIPNPGYGFVCFKKGMKEAADYHFNGAILNNKRLIEFNFYPEINLPHLILASIYAAKGETEKAFDQLRGNKSHHLQALAMLKFNPMFDNIRNEPEFKRILADVETKYADVHQRVGKLLAER
ncbi:MAG: hypothetical protein EP310_07635 [Bacteroidetes bacterium]|nr:MAG: hypothetical protein EP310_07635 [Bacteroidota bacterium]